MNTIEFAIEDGVPYAIDYLNPAPDFERDRITPFYFSHVVEKMTELVIDRALNGQPSQSLAALGGDARHRPRVAASPALRDSSEWISPPSGTRSSSPDETSPAACLALRRRRCATQKLTFGDRVHCPFLRPFLLTGSDEQRIRTAAETIAAVGERVVAGGDGLAGAARRARDDRPGDRPRRDRPGYGTASTASRLDAFLLPDSLHFAEYNAESPAGLGYTQRLCELFDGCR